MTKKNDEPAKRANQQTIDQWISKIDETIGSHRRNIFEFGDLLLAAESELSKSAFKKVLKASGLRSDSNANNYMRVAECKHLRDPKIQNHLPSTLGVLIDLAGPNWGPKAIKMAIEEGVLHPGAQRAKLKKWYDRKLELVSGKAAYLDLQRSIEDGVEVACIIANKNTDINFSELFDGISNKNQNLKLKKNGLGAYSIILKNLSEQIFVTRWNAKSHSELVVLSILNKVFHKYGNEFRDEYIADGMNKIFGAFEEYERQLNYTDIACIGRLIDKKSVKQRNTLEIDDNEYEFLSNYYQIQTKINEEWDKIHSPKKL